MAVNPHSEPAKLEQIITEFFAKSLHIILESRCPFVSSCNYSGKLFISLFYIPSISDTTSKSSTPMSLQFIPDYVGSPLADPLKRLPSVPVAQYSPSSSPFGRRHSWSYDTSRASPPSALPFPSPSPPMCIQGSNILNVLLRYDSAPVYIPTSRLGDAPLSCNKSVLPFSSSNKGTRPTLSLLDRSSSALQGAPNAGKLLSLREEEIAKPSGVKISSNSSPHKSFLRNFSRLLFLVAVFI